MRILSAKRLNAVVLSCLLVLAGTPPLTGQEFNRALGTKARQRLSRPDLRPVQENHRRVPGGAPSPRGTAGRFQQPSQLRAPARPARRTGARTAIRLKNQEARKAPGTWKGKRLQIEVRGLDIHELFKIFSRQAGVSIVAGGRVRGTVTLYLKGVDLWEAFEAVLESNNLAYVRKGEVIGVITSPEFENIYGVKSGPERIVEIIRLKHLNPEPVAELLLSLKTNHGEVLFSDWADTLILIDTPQTVAVMKKTVEILDVAPESKVFTLNYADIDTIVEQVLPLVSRLQGSLQTYPEANRFMVRDSPKRVAEIARIVDAFDVPHREVLIEAKIVQVELNDDHQFGINWNFIFNTINGDNIGGAIVGKLAILASGSQDAKDAENKGTQTTVGKIPQNKFTATLNLLKTVGKTNLLSSPRIMGLHGREATILVGTREAYVTTTVVNPGAGGNTVTSEQVTFVDVGIKLFVTPLIGEDGFVTMKIRPEVSSVNKTITTANGNTIPIVKTSQVETTVMVKSGTTLVIGGLIDDRIETQVNKVPLLGSIPLLGYLFRSESKSVKKTELVIFMTPRIISGIGETVEARLR